MSKIRFKEDIFGITMIVATVIFIACVLCCPALADDNQSPIDLKSLRPEWCKPGYVCEPTRNIANLLIKVEMLEEQVGILKAKRGSKFGLIAGCGPAASLSSTDGNTTLAGTISCVVGYGLRF